MASRPRLKPYFRPLRRGRDAVQLGLSARSGGVVLRGLSPAEIDFLTRLDGTLTETELLRDAAGRRIWPERAAALVALLREHHLLDGDLDGSGPDRVDLGQLPGAPLAQAHLGVDDAPILALPGAGHARAPTALHRLPTAPRHLLSPSVPPLHVATDDGTRGTDGGCGVHVANGVDEADEIFDAAGSAGAGHLTQPVFVARGTGSGTRQLLRRTGWRVVVSGRGRLPWAIGSLLRTTGVGQVDLGPSAVHALDQALRADPSVASPDLVVLVGSGVLDPRSGDAWWRRGVPTLPVVTDGRRIVVGPVVDDRTGPCLHCLDLERSDRDVAWPALVAQLWAESGSGSDDEVSSESTLTTMASGVVAMIVTAHLAGDRSPAGVSVEMSLPWPRLDHRRWARHPRCVAHARHPGARSEGTASAVGGG